MLASLLLALAGQLASGPSQQPTSSASSFVATLAEARAALDASDLVRARTTFERALAIRPESSVCAYELACLAARQGDAPRALAELARAVEWGSDDAEVATHDVELADVKVLPGFAALVERMSEMRGEAGMGWKPGAWVTDQSALPSALSLPLGRSLAPEPFEYGARSSHVSSDGAFIWLGGSDGILRRVELATGATAGKRQLSSTYLAEIQVSSDGRVLLASDGNGRTWIVSASTPTLDVQRELGVFPRGYAVAPAGAVLSPRGDRVLTRGEHFLLWNVDDGSVVADLGPAEFDSAWPRWSHDGARFALADSHGRVRVFETAEPTRPRIEFANLAHIRTLEFDWAGERLGVGTEQATVCVFDLHDGRKLLDRCVDDFGESESSVRCVRFSRDGRSLAATTGVFAFLSVWSMPDKVLRWKRDMEGGNTGTYLAEFSTDGTRILAAGMSPSFTRVVESATGRELADWRGLELQRFELSPTGDRVIGFGRHAMIVFDAQTLRPIYQRVDELGGDSISIKASLFAQGTSRAWQRTLVRVGSQVHSIDSYASLLDDRKRYRSAVSAAVGAESRLPEPPQLQLKSPEMFESERSGDHLDVELSASDPRGLVAMEIEDVESGATLTFLAPAGHPQEWHWKQALAFPSAQRTTWRARAIARSGIASDPVLIVVKRAR